MGLTFKFEILCFSSLDLFVLAFRPLVLPARMIDRTENIFLNGTLPLISEQPDQPQVNFSDFEFVY